MRDFSSVTNIANNYTKMGISAGIHVRIPDVGLELNQDVSNAGTITRQIKPFGGLEQVSALKISNLELSDELKFCTEASCTAKPQGAIRGAGRLISKGAYAESYNDVRNATSADEFAWPTITAGQVYSAGDLKYYNYRGFMQFSIPSGITSCEEGALFLKGLNTSLTSSTDINLILVAGTWSSLGSGAIGDTGLFNDFTGWQASGDYTDYITQLNIAWSTAEFITYSASLSTNEQHNHIRLNAAGLAAIVAATGGTIRFMLLSENDVTNTEPTGNEYAQFYAQDVTLELRSNTKKLKNRTAYVYRYYGTEPSSYTAMAELYRGRIDNFKITNRSLDIDLVKSDIAQNVLMPKMVITENDWPYCPDSNLGKPYPIIYGEFAISAAHKNGVANFTGAGPAGTAVNYGYPDCFRLPIVKENEDDKTVIVSEGFVKAATYPLFDYNHSNGTFEIFPVTAGVSVTTSYTKRDITPVADELIPNVLCENLYKAVACVLPFKTLNTGITNPTYAYDSDTDTYAVIPNSSAYIYFYFQDPGGSQGDGAISLVLYAEFIDGATAASLHIIAEQNTKTNVDDADSWVEYDDVTPWTEDGQAEYAFYRLDASNNRTFASLEQYRFKLVRADDTGDVYIYDVCAMKARQVNKVTELYTYGKGRADNAAGTITGTSTTLPLLENPSHILEDIARNQIGLAAAEIDTTALDTLATDLPSWILAFQLNEQREVNDILDNIGEQCKTNITRDEQDRFTAKTWDVTDYFPHSGTDIAGDLDIFQESCAPAADGTGNDIMTRNPIMDFSLEQINPAEVKNSFVLYYKRNYATSGYEGTITMDNGEGTVGSVDTSLATGDGAYLENSQTIAGLSALCAASFTNCDDTTQTMTVNADFIRDRATAVKFFQHLVETRTAVRHIATIRTRENPALWVENGDMINIRHRRVYEYCGIPTAQKKKWLVYRYDHSLGNGQILLKAIEVNLVA